jgi:hypothetical protein
MKRGKIALECFAENRNVTSPPSGEKVTFIEIE